MTSDSKVDAKIQKLNDLLAFKSSEDKLNFKAIAIQLDILAEVDNIMQERKISRKELADKLGKSKSFISQLFSGDKMLNLKMIAQLQEILECKFQPAFKSYSKPSNKINLPNEDFTEKKYKPVPINIFTVQEGK
ncbi:MAG TPA: helix-turn-helix transcriptional regulator [Ignavibacteriaceae bacterium]|jgi:transcriptional regulator with XRE-family HTH domain|nr:MAG: helix-turn-helix protein [Ignavibacteria bacterium ADurb.Bin266]HQF43250.1 helix-turn-helix transcriptional regulator [Ignavibacteriaceae bacterium]